MTPSILVIILLAISLVFLYFKNKSKKVTVHNDTPPRPIQTPTNIPTHTAVIIPVNPLPANNSVEPKAENK